MNGRDNFASIQAVCAGDILLPYADLEQIIAFPLFRGKALFCHGLRARYL